MTTIKGGYFEGVAKDLDIASGNRLEFSPNAQKESWYRLKWYDSLALHIQILPIGSPLIPSIQILSVFHQTSKNGLRAQVRSISGEIASIVRITPIGDQSEDFLYLQIAVEGDAASAIVSIERLNATS